MDNQQIIKELKSFDTPTISDALDSLKINGGLCGIIPRNKSANICGTAFTVEYREPNEEEQQVAKAADFIDAADENSVIILANNGRADCTVWGNILTQIAIQKKIAGTVIDGACRDIDFIRETEYAMFSKSVYMKTGKGRTKKTAHQVPVTISGTIIQPNDFVRADQNGVIVIPQHVAEEVIKRCKAIEETEEKIKEAVSRGIHLKEARETYKYHRPWENEVVAK
ncbi:RraA family protein [Bacillus inaquosorum]|uniref:RraA family protein n=1 Tax=Bacillus inaquosorum TaxID=483913 RepID=UPI0014529CBB|nr:RraA family protein [Bacillus inaquosorum]QJC88214.1 Putative S-adenosylmethionine--2-demethylmenaquinone methyltransferase, RraA family protein [Bacillus subtilis]QYX44722.1 RraA family protein [Bacillus inaquosorum]WNW24945.1 RraA family protein [Bacillus inaquosorum]